MLSQIIISYICIYVKIIAFIFSDKLIAITNAKKEDEEAQEKAHAFQTESSLFGIKDLKYALMDIVIHYLGKRYIIEVKIWCGERYNADGEQQLIGYLDHFGLDVGYMLSFNFNKGKKIGVERISVGGKTLFEGTM